MRRRMLPYLAIVVGAVLPAALPMALQEAEIRGTITLRDGTAYTGLIQMARLGVTQDVTDGVGMRLKDGGALSLLVGTQKALIPASDIRHVEVTWQETADTNVGGWEIASITVSKKDGSKQSGRPSWLLGCSFVRMDTQDQGTVTLATFPTAKEFDPGKLIASMDIQAPGAAEQPPAEEVPPPLVAETLPAEATTPEAPVAVVETPPATETAVTPAPTVPGPAASLTPAMVTITITCPHCGKPITVTIPATAQ